MSKKSINIPADGNCLFWAAGLAYLTPAKNDDQLFQLKFKCLFDQEPQGPAYESIQNSIQDYNPFMSEYKISNDEIFNKLIAQQFRSRVVAYMRENKTDFQPFIDEDFEQYLDKMHIPSEWGGETEIKAISQLLKCKIRVYGAKTTDYGEGSELLVLHHENLTPNARDSNNRNHYNFEVTASIIDDYERPEQETFDLTSMRQSLPMKRTNEIIENTPIKKNKFDQVETKDTAATSKILGKRLLSLNDDDDDESNSIPTKKKSDFFANKPAEYAASGVKLSLHGTVYQLQLLILFLSRALKESYVFRLATEMDAAEKFDDLVFQYIDTKEQRIVHRFLQAKHKQNETKKITYKDLITENTAGEFSLLKYFTSYCKIKRKPEFIGEAFKDFILCTNIDFDFETLTIAGIKTVEITEADVLLEMKTKNKTSIRYKLVVDSKLELFEKLKETSKLYTLAKELVKCIKSENKKILLRQESIFKAYHTALAQEVIAVNGKDSKFQQDFINKATTLTEAAKNLYEIINNLLKQDTKLLNCTLHLSGAFNNPKIARKEEFVQKLAADIKNGNNKVITVPRTDEFRESVDALAGYILVKNDEKIRFSSVVLKFFFDGNIMTLQTLPTDLRGFIEILKKTLEVKGIDFSTLHEFHFEIEKFQTCEEDGGKPALPRDSVQVQEIAEFFEKLVFAVNQPNEKELSFIIRDELGEEFNLIDSDLIANTIQKEVLAWFIQKEGRFFTNDEGKKLFKDIKKKVNTLILISPTLEYSDKIEKFGIHFKQDCIDELRNFLLANDGKQIFKLITEYNTSSAVKLYQVLHLKDMRYDSYIFIRLKKLLRMQARVINAFESDTNHNLLIIECNENSSIEESELCEIYTRLGQIIKSKNNKKIMFIASQDHFLNKLFKNNTKYAAIYKEIEDTKNNFTDLDDASQNTLLKKFRIMLQGSEISINDLIDEKSKSIIDAKTLGNLINNNEISIGPPLVGLGDVKAYYINRKYIKSDESHSIEYAEEEFLKQINDKQVVIISDTAGMGKSTTLTHLAQMIKNSNPLLWIFRINLNDCTRQLDVQNGKDKKKAMQFLTEDLLKLVTPTLEQALFEYYQQKLIIMCDGFDEISPNYRQTVIDLVQALRNTKIKQIFITTRPHETDELEKQFSEIAYTLKQFSVENQIELLSKFWQQKLNISKVEKDRIRIYAKALVKLLARSLSRRSKNFTGIPLQTRMLAEAFEEDLEKFYKSNDTELHLPEKLDLINLYELFFKRKFYIYQAEKNKTDLTKPNVKNDTDYIKFLKQYQNMALCAIFNDEAVLKFLLNVKFNQEFSEENPYIPVETLRDPDFQRGIFKSKQVKLDAFIKEINEGKRNTGIIDQVIENKPHFVHRTFAEYLVAKFLINNFENESLVQVMLEVIFFEIYYSVIRAFLNDDLGKKGDVPSNTLTLYGNKIAELGFNEDIEYFPIREGNINIITFVFKCLKNHKNVLRSFLMNYKNEMAKSLHIAMGQNYFDVVKLIVSQRADVGIHDAVGDRFSETSTRESLLLMAIKKGNLDLTKWLVEKGAKIDDYIVWHEAAKVGDLDILKYLIEKEANFYAADKKGNTVLHKAAATGNLDVLKWLLEEKNISINVTNNEGGTVMFAAARNRKLNIIEWVMQHSANVKVTNKCVTELVNLAAKTGRLDVIKWLANKLATDISALDEFYNMVLRDATTWHQLDIIKWLTEQGPSIKIKKKYGGTILHFLARVNSFNIINGLIKEIDINAVNNDGNTVLHETARRGSFDVFNYLVEEENININATVVHEVASYNNFYIFSYLVTEMKFNINILNKSGNTILHEAARGGNLDIVKRLVDEKRFDIKTKNHFGDTILHEAARGGNLDIVKWLVDEKRFDINTLNKSGNTILHETAQSGNLDFVNWLLKEEALFMTKTSEIGNRTLEAARKGELNLAKWLVENKYKDIVVANNYRSVVRHEAQKDNLNLIIWLVEKKNMDIYIRNKYGDTILHEAARVGAFDIIKWLIDVKAFNITAKNKYGNTVLHEAQRNNVELVKWLVEERHIDVNIKNENGSMAIHEAARRGDLDIVKWLVEQKGVDINYRNLSNKTSLDVAIEQKQKSVIAFLKLVIKRNAH